MSADVVRAMADELRQYATHFAPSEWDYTRDLGDLEFIRHAADYTGYDRIDRRWGRALRNLLGPPDHLHKMLGATGVLDRWAGFRVSLRKRKHRPDGALDRGGILVHWEETGEYLQYVQPSVGELLANLMDAHPDLPEVLAIAFEMKRINDRYGERLAAEPTEPQ